MLVRTQSGAPSAGCSALFPELACVFRMNSVKEVFSGIAGVYDRMNHALSLGLDRRWRRIAAKCAASVPSSILDVACGTGDMSLELARAFPDARIVGVDFTPEMLEIARRKCEGESRVEFREGDAMALPFETGDGGAKFDFATCAWGFRNFPDKAKALSECARVLADGGTLVVLEFFRPGSRILGALTALWLRLLAPLLAPGKSGAYAYLRESMRATVSEGEFVALAEKAGFAPTSRRFLFPACTCLAFAKCAPCREPAGVPAP